MTKKAGLYLRTWGDESVEGAPDLASQREAGQEYARKQGYRIVAEMTEDSADGDGYLGGTGLRLVRWAEGAEIKLLIVGKPDLLARVPSQQYHIADSLTRKRIEIAFSMGDFRNIIEAHYLKELQELEAEYDYLMGERLTCGKCGSEIHGTSRRFDSPPRTHLFYQCSAPTLQSCDTPLFRADHVDGLVWDWVRSLLTRPDALAVSLEDGEGYRETLLGIAVHQAFKIRSRLRFTETGLEMLDRFHRLGEFSDQQRANRKAWLEASIAGLEGGWEREMRDVEACQPDEEPETLSQFAQRFEQAFDAVEDDYNIKAKVIEALDIRATLGVDDGEKVVFTRCVLGEDRLPLVGGSAES
jgi:hypothetical protein